MRDRRSQAFVSPVLGFQFYLWKITWAPFLHFEIFTGPIPQVLHLWPQEESSSLRGVRPHPGCADVLELGNGWEHLLRGVMWGSCSLSLPRLAHSPKVLRAPPNLFPPPHPGSDPSGEAHCFSLECE